MEHYRVFAHETLASTNDEAMARLKAGDPGEFFVTAVTQTGGRGRQGRAWQSPAGNLYASLAVLDPAPPALAPQLGFVAGVALARALRERLDDDPRLAIKWPNDMVFEGAKLAGILLECTTLPTGTLGCVIGFGVNCLSHPSDLPYRATDLRAAGDPAPDPASVLAGLAESLHTELAIWHRGAGFPAIRAAWLSLAAGLGQTIKVSTPRRSLVGTFEGLDGTGRLCVATGEGRVEIEAGDVFLAGMDVGKAVKE